MSYLQTFRQLLSDFQHTDLFAAMENTVEDSPWHREANVGVHTIMVVTEYLALTSEVKWTKDHLKGAIACLFHDVGKPDAKEERTSPERGTYFRFAGHELISARLMEDYMVKNWDRFSDVLTPFDIYCIGWMIENHLPYGVKKIDKRQKMKTTAHYVFPENPEVFEFALMADQFGRISDDQESKLRKMEEWLEDYRSWDVLTFEHEDNCPTLVLPVGPSSSGKSSFCELYRHDHEIFSWDAQRLERYPFPKSLQVGEVSQKEIYDYACQQSFDDSSFYTDSLKAFNDLVKQRKSVVVDNMNLSEKRRRQFADIARRRGYFIETVLFPVCIDQLVERDTSRGDRGLGENVVRDMFMRLTYPSISPLNHKVTVYNGNLR